MLQTSIFSIQTKRFFRLGGKKQRHPTPSALPFVDNGVNESHIESLEYLVVPGSSLEIDPDSSLQSCLKLLSSSDLDQNRLGLQRLRLLTKGRTLSGLHRSEKLASYVLIYGGKLGSIEELLRYVFATFFCDAPHRDSGVQRSRIFLHVDNDDDSTNPYLSEDDIDYGEGLDNAIECSADYQICNIPTSLVQIGCHESQENIFSFRDDSTYSSATSTEGEYGPQGKSWGALHSSALQVLANALGQIAPSAASTSPSSTKKVSQNIPLHDTVWQNIILSLIHNIEINHTADITGYSLKILRLLHSIHPDMVQPLLSQSIFPYLVHLMDQYQEDERFQMIYYEASCLLRRIKNCTQKIVD